MQKGRTGRFTMKNKERIKSTLIVIFWFKGTPAKDVSWYLEEGNATDIEDYPKGY